jgi:hypothetical protein
MGKPIDTFTLRLSINQKLEIWASNIVFGELSNEIDPILYHTLSLVFI